MIYSRVAGTGRYLPERIMTNADLEKIVDTSDEWIRTRTGVERRHVCAEDETVSQMCIEAAKVAMEAAGVTANDIDMVITGTTTPDLIFQMSQRSFNMNWVFRLAPLSASKPLARDLFTR